MRNCQIKLPMHVKILPKNYFAAKVWPAVGFVYYVSTKCVEAIK